MYSGRGEPVLGQLGWSPWTTTATSKPIKNPSRDAIIQVKLAQEAPEPGTYSSALSGFECKCSKASNRQKPALLGTVISSNCIEVMKLLRKSWPEVRPIIAHSDVCLDKRTKREEPRLRPPCSIGQNPRQLLKSSLFIAALKRKCDFTDFCILPGQRGAEFQTSELPENVFPQMNSLECFRLAASLLSSCVPIFPLSFCVCSLCWGQYCSQENT